MKETFFSRLYEVTPSVEKYLERIGYTGKAEPTLECLNALISAHQRSVPYENLDVGRYHLPITLNIDHLYEKIVLNHRGGYCFENNTSFLSLLRGVGFDARPCMCRIMFGVPGVVPQVSHRASIITIDGEEYFADVGTGGPMSDHAVPMAEGSSVHIDDETYHFEHIEGDWYYLITHSANMDIRKGRTEVTERTLLMVSTHLCAPQDFDPYNFCCYQPYAKFYQNEIAYLRTRTGCIKLENRTLITVDNGVSTIRELESDEVDAVLRDLFGVVVTDEYLAKFVRENRTK